MTGLPDAKKPALEAGDTQGRRRHKPVRRGTNQRAALPGNDRTAHIASCADVAVWARLSATAVLLKWRAELSSEMSWGSAVGKAGDMAKGKLLPNVASRLARAAWLAQANPTRPLASP